MSNRTVYEVAPRGDEWTVKRRGVERPLHVEKTKAEAVGKGIELARLTSKGYGMEVPIVPNTTDQNRALNRRVQFVRTEGAGAGTPP